MLKTHIPLFKQTEDAFRAQGIILIPTPGRACPSSLSTGFCRILAVEQKGTVSGNTIHPYRGEEFINPFILGYFETRVSQGSDFHTPKTWIQSQQRIIPGVLVPF